MVSIYSRHFVFRTSLLVVLLAATHGTSVAQSLPPMPPRLSWQAMQYYKSHPQKWQRFTSQLPRLHAGPAAARPAASPWQAVKAPAPAAGLSAPQLLTDGTVLLHAACTRNWYKLTPDIHGGYINGSWSTIAPLPSGYAPLYFAAEVLNGGRLIINGGEYNNTTSCDAVWTTLGAIYDSVTDVWTPIPPPSGWTTIGDAQSVVLNNGTYMLASCCDSPPKAAFFNANTLTWSPTGGGKADRYDEEGWTLLPNGTVLTADASTDAPCSKNTELYNPATGNWSSAGNSPMQLSDCNGSHPTFEVGPLVLRADGTVVAFSGVATGAVAGTAIFNSSTKKWAAGPNLPTISGVHYDLADAPASWLPTGNILFAASPGFTNGPTHFFGFGTTNSLGQVADTPNSPFESSYVVNLLLLPTGQVLETDFSAAVEIYTPALPANLAWAPVITSVPTTLMHGLSYQVTGKQLNGLTQGAAYGDDEQSSTNFPLVRITNNATGHLFYARTFGFNTRSVAPGTVSTASFLVPLNIETGASSLTVVANGLPSKAVAVTVK